MQPKREQPSPQHLKTELPGPKARAMLARDVEVASPSYPRDYPFVMSHGRGGRARSGARGAGPRAVVTDFGILTPDQDSDELVLTALYAGVGIEEAQTAVGWTLSVARDVVRIPAPYAHELTELRALNARTHAAHQRVVELPI